MNKLTKPEQAMLLKAIDALTRFIYDARYNESMGICGNLKLAMEHPENLWFDENASAWIRYELLPEFFRSWCMFSGDPEYPVPVPEGSKYEDSRDIYSRMYFVWSGEYGELRRDLCRHIRSRMHILYNSSIAPYHYRENSNDAALAKESLLNRIKGEVNA